MAEGARHQQPMHRAPHPDKPPLYTEKLTKRHMHQISDGERRRVQLCMGLMGEWDVLLLDEVTVDLDVLVRSELIDYLVQESETRGATIVCEFVLL